MICCALIRGIARNLKHSLPHFEPTGGHEISVMQLYDTFQTESHRIKPGPYLDHMLGMAHSSFRFRSRHAPKAIVGLLALLVTLLSKLLGCNVKPSHPKSSEALPLILKPTDLLGEHTVQLDQRTASASAIAGALIPRRRRFGQQNWKRAPMTQRVTGVGCMVRKKISTRC